MTIVTKKKKKKKREEQGLESDQVPILGGNTGQVRKPP